MSDDFSVECGASYSVTLPSRNQLLTHLLRKEDCIDFLHAKKAVEDIHTVYFPHPDDNLHLYSDYSQPNHAVGGRLEIHRHGHDVSNSILHGGFFSSKIPHSQARWQPCEGESLGVRLVAEHFRPVLRESNNTVIKHRLEPRQTLRTLI